MTDEIATSAEAAEAAVLPCVHEVHADPDACTGIEKLPEPLQKPVADKSAARWAYERLILYIKNFEEQLDGEHEVAMGFAGGDAGVMRIEGMGYFDPDIITYYGSDSSGARTQLVQHVSQLNVMLRALPKRNEAAPANRIGFRLVSDLEGDGSET
ncbi:DUF6173 family protein [Phaeobacter gallaeciensis]|uniref:Uncharacterized protein n=1 Tax=Phaeobacter gallaeciensis TaxID=60890 RepID=A0AAC9ZBJ6_9RHOB|nr:DUF6173 family protein [Phaeobacter gallaeciensis]AHD10917.1 hypothetical protein Gal_03189 [Phaeobacter gallaeciensis DSM 26640]ATE94180.1 hypothetical protein PhaeoP11_03177 [Phaeobacter gallaeciensis]ATE95999.1 hypothetical protein PhaeoP73_00670 [Phaeobacter gallaeciensis]ATF02844.1 hypothetical protein PhaeoP75_03226 [Phaeobacter gallaeciensis]ATF07224.1 hypothetical protein PhaeoP63_03175 [Phaeobacter gallaeciensis]